MPSLARELKKEEKVINYLGKELNKGKSNILHGWALQTDYFKKLHELINGITKDKSKYTVPFNRLYSVIFGKQLYLLKNIKQDIELEEEIERKIDYWLNKSKELNLENVMKEIGLYLRTTHTAEKIPSDLTTKRVYEQRINELLDQLDAAFRETISLPKQAGEIEDRYEHHVIVMRKTLLNERALLNEIHEFIKDEFKGANKKPKELDEIKNVVDTMKKITRLQVKYLSSVKKRMDMLFSFGIKTNRTNSEIRQDLKNIESEFKKLTA